ncbi:MAG: hypothetical protein IKC35_02065 [Clostridia bacterium]|nr:hypothetical protein [Clostridia bacterium]
MKRFASIILVCLVLLSCIACGPYGNYAGTYTKSSDSATFTVTLSASGNFKFEREFKTSNEFNPFDDDKHNIREGTFAVENGEIIIQFSYYDDALRKTVKATAKAKVNGKKLTISGSDEIKGTYTKQ